MTEEQRILELDDYRRAVIQVIKTGLPATYTTEEDGARELSYEEAWLMLPRLRATTKARIERLTMELRELQELEGEMMDAVLAHLERHGVSIGRGSIAD